MSLSNEDMQELQALRVLMRMAELEVERLTAEKESLRGSLEEWKRDFEELRVELVRLRRVERDSTIHINDLQRALLNRHDKME